LRNLLSELSAISGAIKRFLPSVNLDWSQFE
jgi:hypothetical protein